MNKVSQFKGSLRAMGGLATLTMRELLRTGAAPISFFLYLIFLAAHSTDHELELRAASSQFIDHSLGGLAVFTMFLAMFFGMQLAARGENVSQGAFQLRRLVGPGSYFWGRLLGLASIMVLFGLLAGAIIVVHHSVRFGGEEEGFQLESRVESESFGSSRDTRFMRKKGDKVTIPFELSSTNLIRFENKGLLIGRFAPILVLTSDGGEARANCPIRVEIEDPKTGKKKRTYVRIHEGRAGRFEVKWPTIEAPDKLNVTLENRSSSYLVKFRRSDLQLITGTATFSGGLMRAALALSLLATALAAIALFFREHMAFGPALIASVGLAVLSVSVEILEFGILSDASVDTREMILAFVTTVLPDSAEFDVVQDLARGQDIRWRVAFDLGQRVVFSGILLGLISGWTQSRRKSL